MTVPSAPWDRVFSDIKISIPGAIDAVIQQELFRVTMDFFDSTNAWTEEIPVQVTPSSLTYPLTLAGKGQINRLLLVYDPANASPDRRWVQGMVGMRMPDILVLPYAPSSATTWNAVVGKTPLDPTNTENYPDLDPDVMWAINAYRDCFVTGTLANMFKQPAKPYTNLQLAGLNGRDYISQRGRARADVLHKFTYNGQTWQFPQSYATTARKGWT